MRVLGEEVQYNKLHPYLPVVIEIGELINSYDVKCEVKFKLLKCASYRLTESHSQE